ncbi:MAG: hypothetical protein BWY31_04696 [Lentisphaerae bacterium ADurb.Bin242]|nr:MAG: hypothetical protein BWY31_04696 [Lentisphaerae bacterium ADurb.Bin242]
MRTKPDLFKLVRDYFATFHGSGACIPDAWSKVISQTQKVAVLNIDCKTLTVHSFSIPDKSQCQSSQVGVEHLHRHSKIHFCGGFFRAFFQNPSAEVFQHPFQRQILRIALYLEMELSGILSGIIFPEIMETNDFRSFFPEYLTIPVVNVSRRSFRLKYQNKKTAHFRDTYRNGCLSIPNTNRIRRHFSARLVEYLPPDLAVVWKIFSRNNPLSVLFPDVFNPPVRLPRCVIDKTRQPCVCKSAVRKKCRSIVFRMLTDLELVAGIRRTRQNYSSFSCIRLANPR